LKCVSSQRFQAVGAALFRGMEILGLRGSAAAVGLSRK
jgi:hypothetical protein